MSTGKHFDLIVIGGGPAGSKAAQIAAQGGMKTALSEAGFLGGTCLNSGCVPTKYLLGATSFVPLLEAQQARGTASGTVTVDLAAMQTRKDAHIKESRQALQRELEQAGVALFRAKGSFTGPRRLRIKGSDIDEEYGFTRCIVATGSVPAVFPGIRPDGATVHSPASILNIKKAPESLIILGGGAIGLETGELFHRLGTKIIIAEGAPRLLPGEELSTSRAVYEYLTGKGWNIYTGKRITSLSTQDGRSLLEFENGETLTAACSLLAAGRRPATQGLAPEAAGLAVRPNGWLETDAFLKTSEHVYAVGDINARLMMSHAAYDQARYAARHALGEEKGPYSPPVTPACIYGTIDIMRVGPTVAELQKSGKNVAVSRAFLAENSLAQSYGHPEGFVEMSWVEGELAAVNAVGHGVSHLMTAAALLVEKRVKKNFSCGAIFAHPTLDEALESAMLAPLVEFSL